MKKDNFCIYRKQIGMGQNALISGCPASFQIEHRVPRFFNAPPVVKTDLKRKTLHRNGF
jgi:hypothetical protein